MTKEQKVNWIKSWLQKFGNRDNETFNISIHIGSTKTTWNISLQYDYDFDGDRIEPCCWCSYSFKHVRNNQLQDRTNEELNSIINVLRNKKIEK